jgi:glutamate carboxypeptidase
MGVARLDNVDTAQLVAHLETLVNAESPSDDLALLQACARVVGSLGAELLGEGPEEVTVDGRSHLLWRFGGQTSVVLIGHYDTVWPAGTLSRWPFQVDDSGRATGPGAFDMKAGIVQMFHAVAALDQREGVSILLTADEEIGSPTSRLLIEQTAAGARAALVLEPSASGALKVARKGTSMYRVVITGRAAHAGLEPEKGVNATVELAHQALAVARLGRPEIGTTVTPTVASSGTTTNTVPASAFLDVDVRASSAAEQERVDSALRELQPCLPGASLRVEGGINRPPLDRASSADLYELARGVADRLGLLPLAGVAVGGGSDGNFTAGVGVPTLDGLGAEGDGAHAEGEYALVGAMPARAALLAGVVAEILAG